MATGELTLTSIEKCSTGELFKLATNYGIIGSSTWELRQKLIVYVMEKKGSVIDLSRYTEAVMQEKEETLLEDEKRRQKLEIYLEDIKRIYKTIMSFDKIKEHQHGELVIIERDDPLISFINNEMKTVAEDLEKMTEMVHKKPNCTLLICGDSGAGKSSFINLLLSETLLPTSIRSNSACQVRLTYGEHERAEIVDRDSVMVTMEKAEFPDKLSSYLESLDDRKTPSCKSASIFLKSVILEGGLDIYDTIGLGETERFNNELKKELNQITGIIFLLKKNNPIGDTTIGGLSEIISLLANQGLPSRCMNFIINMCDQLKDEQERENLRANVVEQLREKCWLNNPEVRTFSTKQELDFQTNNVMTTNYKEIIQLIHQLHISSINSNTVRVFSFILKFVQQTIDQINQLEKYSASDKAERKDYILRLRNLEHDRKLINQRFSNENRKFLTDEKKLTKKKVEDHFKKSEIKTLVVQEVLNRQSELYGMTKIDEIDVKIEEISHEEISKSFKQFIETKAVLKGICDKMLGTFIQQFAEHQKKKEKIHKTMNRHIDKTMAVIEGDFKDIITDQAQKKGFLYLISPILVPIVMIKENIIKTTWFSHISAIFNRVNIHTFYDDTSTYVTRQASSKYSSYFNKSRNITELIECLFKAPEKVTKDFDKYIADDMDYLAKNIQSLDEDMRQKEIVFGTYKEIKEKLETILEEICQFSILRLHKETKHIMNNKIQFLPSLDNGGTEIKPIVKGRNRVIFRGQVECETLVDSCIMVFRCKDGKTWRQFYEEYKQHNEIKGIRQKKEFAEVAQYFLDLKRHVIFDMNNTKPTLRPTFLVDGIECSLRAYIDMQRKSLLSNNEHNELPFYELICHLLKQILSGLKYLHSNALVHYDLTQDSIGYSTSGIVKLTSVSLPTKVKVKYDKISCDYVEQMAHLPIKILDPDTNSDTLYDNNCDIYCLGIMLYSMWIGIHPFFDAIQNREITKISDFVTLIKKEKVDHLIIKDMFRHSFAQLIDIWSCLCREEKISPEEFLVEVAKPRYIGQKTDKAS